MEYFESIKRLVIKTDASNKTIAVVISQEIKEKLQLLGFMSKKITSAGQNYTIIEKKMLAII